MKRLADRRMLVVGASSGIGRAIAVALGNNMPVAHINRQALPHIHQNGASPSQAINRS